MNKMNIQILLRAAQFGLRSYTFSNSLTQPNVSGWLGRRVMYAYAYTYEYDKEHREGEEEK